VKGTVLLLSMATAPTPFSVDRNIGTTAVAVVLATVVFALVEISLLLPWLAGLVHCASEYVPTPPNEVPVNVTSVPAHPSFGLTDVKCQADAAWALAKNSSSPKVPATRLARLTDRMRIATNAPVEVP
jgi:hypothetical protein